MSNVVLFQKSWEEKKIQRERKPSVCISLLLSSCPVGWFSSTWPASLWEGGMILTSHKERERWLPVSPWLSTNLGHVWRERRETAGAAWCLPSAWGSSKQMSEKPSQLLPSSEGPGVGGKLMEMSLLRPTEQGTKGSKGANHFLCLEFLFWIAVLFSVSSSLLRTSGYWNPGPSYL